MTPRGPNREDRGIYRRGTVWWICYSQGGHTYRESSRSSRKKVARDLLKKRLGEIGSGRLIGPNAEKVTLGDLGEMLFADYEARGLKSLVRMRQHIKHLAEYFGGHARALDITWDAATRYIAHRRQEVVDPLTGDKVAGAKPATIKGELAARGGAGSVTGGCSGVAGERGVGGTTGGGEGEAGRRDSQAGWCTTSGAGACATW